MSDLPKPKEFELTASWVNVRPATGYQSISIAKIGNHLGYGKCDQRLKYCGKE